MWTLELLLNPLFNDVKLRLLIFYTKWYFKVATRLPVCKYTQHCSLHLVSQTTGKGVSFCSISCTSRISYRGQSSQIWAETFIDFCIVTLPVMLSNAIALDSCAVEGIKYFYIINVFAIWNAAHFELTLLVHNYL